MAHTPVHGIPMIEEDDASPEIAEIYAEIKHDLQSPYVPNWAKATAPSPVALKMYMGIRREFHKYLTLPESLVAMILYTVAKKTNCVYCAATNELECRTLGVDEQTLDAIANDLQKIEPERTRSIVEFALTSATDPQSLGAEDFDKLRGYGITDEEILEIGMVAAMAVFNDVLADTFKVEVDPEVTDALSPK